MSGWQLSGDAPTYYMRFAYAMQEPWTDDLIRQARCKDGERVLDVACGPGLVAGRVNQVSNGNCNVAGLDINETMLNAAKKTTDIEWHLGSCAKNPLRSIGFGATLGAAVMA